VVQAQKTGGGAGQPQHDAVAVTNENMAIGMVRGTLRRGDDFKLPAIERMGRIGHLEGGNAIVRAVRVVEGGINIRYRSTECIISVC
jgi:hypothetical protein